MTKQERAAKILLLMLQFSVLIAKQEQKKKKLKVKIHPDDMKFLQFISSRRYANVTPRQFTKLQELKEKYL